MRHTKRALLLFGLGAALGLVVAVGGFAQFGWVASGLMALALVLLPLALFADGRFLAIRAWLARLPRRRRRKKPRGTSRPSPVRRKQPARAAARAPRRGRGR